MKKAEVLKEMTNAMYIVNVFGKQHVVTTNYIVRKSVDPITGSKTITPDGNYTMDNRGKVLCGILKENQTIEEFKASWIEKKNR